MLTYKTKQYLFVLIKVVVLIAAPAFIYFRLTEANSLSMSQFTDFVKSISATHPTIISLLFLLVFLNWFFEILKWKSLVTLLKPISFTESTRQVLSAQSAALFTPLKIGEYGLKTMFFESFLSKKVFFLNFLSNFSQLLATLIFGSLGLFYFAKINFPDYLPIFWGVMAILLFIVVFRKKTFSFIRIFFSKKAFLFLNNFSPQGKIQLLGFAFLRYLAFSLQFYILLNVFTPVPFWETLCLIFTYYLISSAFSVIQLLDIAVKTSVAFLVFPHIQPLSLLFITLFMWLLNAVFPAIIGSGILVSLKPNSQTSPV